MEPRPILLLTISVLMILFGCKKESGIVKIKDNQPIPASTQGIKVIPADSVLGNYRVSGTYHYRAAQMVGNFIDTTYTVSNLRLLITKADDSTIHAKGIYQFYSINDDVPYYRDPINSNNYYCFLSILNHGETILRFYKSNPDSVYAVLGSGGLAWGSEYTFTGSRLP